MVTTELADYKQLSTSEIDVLYSIMHHAYEVTEIEIWGANYTRMSREEFVDCVKQKSIILARLNDNLVGSIQTYPLDSSTFGFGLLSADFNEKGKGIGRALIVAAEELAKSKGANKMELEILKPKDFDVPVKIALKEWYNRLGYTFDGSFLFEERKPDKAEKAKNFVVPCVFDCYSKAL